MKQSLIINGNKFSIQKEQKPKEKTLKTFNQNITQFNPNNTGVVTPREISELQGSLIELNNDDFNPTERTSKIDMRSRLYNIEISSILVIDMLIKMKFLPSSTTGLTSQKKRLAVSLMGKGREEIVQIVGGKREHEQMVGGMGFGSKLKGLFGGNNNV
jgi:hypothetical protein